MVSEKEFQEIIDHAESLHLSDPDEEERYLKSILTKDFTQSQYITLNLQLAYSFLVLSRYNDSYQLYKQMLEFASEEKNEELYADALEGIGNTLTDIGNKKEAKKKLKEAISIYQKLKLPEKESKASNTLAVLYFQANEYEEAIKWYEIAQNLTEDKKSIRYVNALGNSGLIYFSQGNMEKAAEIYEQAVNIAKECHYTFVRLIFQEKLGETYRELGYLEKSEANFNDAFDFAVKMKDDKHIGTLSTFLANFWLEMGNFPKAYKYLKFGLNHLKKVNFPFGLLDNYYVSAQFWLAKGQLNYSKQDLNKALNIIRTNGIFEVECDVLTLLAEVHEALGELDESFQCLKKADNIAKERNSNFQHAMVLLQRARISLNLKKFEESITLLNEVLWMAGGSDDMYLIYDSNMLFSQIYLTMYLNSPLDSNLYNLAYKYLNVAINLTKDNKLVPRYINSIIIEALLLYSQGNYEDAISIVERAKKLAMDSQMMWKIREFDERLLLCNDDIKLEKNYAIKKEFILLVALEDLRKITFSYPNYVINKKDIEETYSIAYEIKDRDNLKIQCIDIDGQNENYYIKVCKKMGLIYSPIFYDEIKTPLTIFGPFPFNEENMSSIILKIIISDDSNSVKTIQNRKSLLICLVFPRKMNSLFFDKEKMDWIFYNQYSSLKNVSQITQETLKEMRYYILNTLILDLQKSIDEYLTQNVEKI